MKIKYFRIKISCPTDPPYYGIYEVEEPATDCGWPFEYSIKTGFHFYGQAKNYLKKYIESHKDEFEGRIY